MLFQILDANYVYDKTGNPVIQLFGCRESGKSVILRVSGFSPYFYAEAKEGSIDLAKSSISELGLLVEEVERFRPIGYQAEPSRMIRVITKDPKEVKVERERVLGLPGIRAVYESDILFRNRFLIDRGLGGMRWALAVGDFDGFQGKKYPVLDLDSVAPVKDELLTNAPLRYMAFDIECLSLEGKMPVSDLSPVILISLAFAPPYKNLDDLVLVGREVECKRPDVYVFRDEKEMLAGFVSIIREFDPDVIAGYNSNEFDFPYLADRANKLKVDVSVGRDGSSWHIRKIVNQTQVGITGRVIVDLLPQIRASFSLKQYTLRNTSLELIGMEKHDIDPWEMGHLWNSCGADFARLVSYSRRDAVLTLKLLLDLGLLDKHIALAQASGALLQDVINGGQTGMVENLLLRKFRERDRVVPPKPDSELADIRHSSHDELKGGEVLTPLKGLLENVIILDYKSLYPTIMMAHNLCYSTVLGEANGRRIAGKDIDEASVIKAPSGGEFVVSEVSPGIVPEILRDLLAERVEIKGLMDHALDEERRVLDAKQYALKILLNSFYGYSGYARARLYSLTLANAVTSFGRSNILNTRDLIEKIESIYVKDLIPAQASGAKADLPLAKVAQLPEEISEQDMAFAKRFDLSVVYGDTDSVFVGLTRRDDEPLEFRPSGRREIQSKKANQYQEITLQEAEVIGRKISEHITSQLPEPMELVFEGFAKRAFFLAKKRYAMWVFERDGEGWKDRIKVRGMETVRRDWCELTSKTLKRCLELVLKEGKTDEAREHVKSTIRRIQDLDMKKDRDMLDDMTLTRRFTKSSTSYKSKQPHIQLVEKMRRRGGHVPSVGDRVPFVILRGKGLFVDRAEDPDYAVEHNLSIDTDYYIEKQLLPPVLRILTAFGTKKEELTQSMRQQQLLDFRPAKAEKVQTQKSLLDF